MAITKQSCAIIDQLTENSDYKVGDACTCVYMHYVLYLYIRMHASMHSCMHPCTHAQTHAHMHAHTSHTTGGSGVCS